MNNILKYDWLVVTVNIGDTREDCILLQSKKGCQISIKTIYFSLLQRGKTKTQVLFRNSTKRHECRCHRLKSPPVEKLPPEEKALAICSPRRKLSRQIAPPIWQFP